MKVLVVGAGFSGATIARCLADRGIRVDVIDRRNHIGGNAWDYVNSHGIRVHAYGPHIFHTKNHKVFEWLSQFTKWTPYQHRVQALLESGDLVPFPPNQDTLKLVPQDKILDTFYRPYSEKMWGMSWEQLGDTVKNRVPPQDRNTDLYFPNDPMQCLPTNGYSALFANVLDHPNITVSLNTTFDKCMERDYCHTFNSGSIDEYYGEILGPLPYRTLTFEHVTLPCTRVFPVSVVNFTTPRTPTRIVEWKNFPNCVPNPLMTTLTWETPGPSTTYNDRFYPIVDKDGINRRLYQSYLSIPNSTTTFVGRCGSYAYIDMDQAVNQAMMRVLSWLNTQAS